MELYTVIIAAASLLPADSAMQHLAEPAYQNPAMKQWMMPRSHSEIGPQYHRMSHNRPVDVQDGRGEDYWSIKADTYLKYKSSTLWGDASYSNGKQRDVVWNETADRDLIYPYLSADSVGGDISLERYRFAGGYADHTDSWAWGATISYDAGLYYRNVDPRPRNVTGLLAVSAGGARRLTGSYFAGLSVSYGKYKQSSDIDFKSQTGVEKVYHLTGLGNHYYRFAGVGLESYYNGSRYGATVNLYPSSGRGFAVSANFSRFTFNKVLTGLNKLPLAHVWHNELVLQSAYMHPGAVHDWGVAADFTAYRRHGSENLFGDASSGMYPQIGTLDMYADNRWSPEVFAIWQFHPAADGLFMWVRGAVSYDHRAEVYATPRRRMETNHAKGSLGALMSMPLRGAWRATVSAGASYAKAASCSLSLADAGSQEPAGVVDLERYRYKYLSGDSHSFNARIGLQRQINEHFGLTLSALWERTGYVASTHRDTFTASLSVNF